MTWAPSPKSKEANDSGSGKSSDETNSRCSRVSISYHQGSKLPSNPTTSGLNPATILRPSSFDPDCIMEIATPPYMSPGEETFGTFHTNTTTIDQDPAKSGALQIIFPTQDQERTATDISEENKEKQESPSIVESAVSLDGKPITSAAHQSVQSKKTSEAKESSLSLTKLLFLVPAFDGKGRNLNVSHFNASDFEAVSFLHYGIHPRSYFITYWDFVISGFLMVILWIVPFVVSFSADFPVTDIQFWSVFISVTYVLDSLVVLATPQPTLSNELCNLLEYESLRPTLFQWIKSCSWKKLPLDILAIIPFELLLESWTNNADIFLLRCLRFYRLPRILSQCGIYKRLRTFTDTTAGFPICNIIPIAAAMLYFLHYNACCLYYFGKLKGFVGWIVVWPEITHATLFEFYFWCFYQAVGNMFPINFTPQTELEQIVAAIFIVSAAILYGRLYDQKIEELNDYVKWKNLSPDTEKKLFSYYEIKYRGKYFEEDSLLAEMNDSLREEIVLHNTRWLIEKVAFLRRVENDGRDEIFFSRIASKLHACYYTPGDFITKQGEAAMDMYFILSGKCDVFVGDRKVVSLFDGAYFGEVALISKILRTASVQAAMHSDFHQILSEFADMKERIDILSGGKRKHDCYPAQHRKRLFQPTKSQPDIVVEDKDFTDIFGTS
ncbi:hypothetical protein BDR26DRAFT_867587 [Obelidium mucronatum]|nr:hypothetical protein BDR26DRAFT_867587 [Obelidium mucronatum]